jgi:hypothetical protein
VGNLQRRHVTKDVAPESPLGRGCTRSIFLPLRPWVDGGPDISRTGGLGDGIGLLLAAAPDRSGGATDARRLGTDVLLNAFRQREKLFPHEEPPSLSDRSKLLLQSQAAEHRGRGDQVRGISLMIASVVLVLSACENPPEASCYRVFESVGTENGGRALMKVPCPPGRRGIITTGP